jgi:hypothetical protein
MAFIEVLNDASVRHGCLRKIPRSAHLHAVRAYEHAMMQLTAIVPEVELPGHEILCCCCAGGKAMHVYGDACFKAYRCAALLSRTELTL